ncbi:MAG: hypothetical protein ABI759_31615 [Candidatus Solibacter sp.]
MTCPFLKEAQVKYCQTSSLRKLLPIAVAGRAEEKCSSTQYLTCPVYRMQTPQPGEGEHCPYLGESLMQYCGAAPVAKMIPYSESQLSRCECDRFHYCELYLSMAHPGANSGRTAGEVDGIAVPDWLSYSANHMWLDVGEDGVCHAGIDAFLSRALGTVERISYVWQKGNHRPTAVITVNGVDLEFVFPNPFVITNCNLYLRAEPSRLTAEPYTAGWLFEGTRSPETTQSLLRGAAARQWMEREQHRINEFLQQQETVSADGGLFAPGLAHHLDQLRMRELFHTFFSPLATHAPQGERVTP